MGQILNNTRFFKSFNQIMITNPFVKGTHNGIDLVAYDGKSTRVDYIKAHDDGVVVDVGFDYYGGNFIKLQTNSKDVELYQHLADKSIKVKKGDKVIKGAVIAYMGNTGAASKGAHLHWGILRGGEWIDPTPYLDKDVTSTMATPAPASNSFKAGDKVVLSSINSYQSPDAKVTSGARSGIYYIWSTEVNMGRIRLTNKPERVGVVGQVSFFVNVADISKVATSTTSTASTTPTQTHSQPQPVKKLTKTSYPNLSGNKYYRIRKSWTNADSQVGAWQVFEYAFNKYQSLKGMGYHIYNHDGKVIE